MSAPTTPPPAPPGTASAQPTASVAQTPVTTPTPPPPKNVRRAGRRSNAIPRKDPKCLVCNHPDADEILKLKMAGETNVGLIKRFFVGKTAKTVANSMTTHWDNHINLKTSVAVLQAIVPESQGIPLPVSTQRIFNKAAKERINAQQLLEAMLVTLMERFNLLEDEFLSHYLAGKCDVCNRGPEQHSNLSKLLSVVKEIRETNGEWMKLRNPKAVMKHFFDSTFLKFFQNMMAHYTFNLQEKGQSIRQAVTEYAEGKISHQLLLRRIAEVEDLGATAIGEKGIRELRQIQEHIDKEFAKGGWAG